MCAASFSAQFTMRYRMRCVCKSIAYKLVPCMHSRLIAPSILRLCASQIQCYHAWSCSSLMVCASAISAQVAMRYSMRCVCNSVAHLLKQCQDSAKVVINVRPISAAANCCAQCLFACLHASLAPEKNLRAGTSDQHPSRQNVGTSNLKR